MSNTIQMGDTRIIEGRYCRVTRSVLQVTGNTCTASFDPDWIAVGSNAPDASPTDKLAWAIGNHPGTHFLGMLKTDEQLEEWVACKDASIRIAKCVAAGGLANPDFEEELRTGDLDPSKLRRSQLSARLYVVMWNLIEADERRIVESMKLNWHCPFDNGLGLFNTLLNQDLGQDFANCLKPRHVFKANDLKRNAMLKRKSHKGTLTKVERAELYRIIDSQVPTPNWCERFADVCNALARRGHAPIATALDDYGRAIAALSDTQIREQCGPANNARRQHSYSWVNGRRLQGIQPGWKG
ncbi:hypothetical protein [Gloeobacter morelensis]|uniref:Uncharacterized protein n=1 Tax=Gloeobacter morelensis MG652769 TaxID=2781736 RepID=A0ABY3PLJ6_9CYAN|nr:hypothetical protein [Gloeobacter morelensis]UFP94469.1 hypothetical protein ISF26_22460 [Gloeobacter morelensis MG652769]